MKKKCTMCKQEKDITKFHKKSTGRYGVCERCSECKNKIDKVISACNTMKMSSGL